MAMTGLPIPECREIYAYLRDELPCAPGPLLEELAFYFTLDAPVDIDPSDIVAVLSLPGSFKILVTEYPDPPQAGDGLIPALTLMDSACGDLRSAAGALLVLKGPALSVDCYSSALHALSERLHPETVLGSALYRDRPKAINRVLLAISGIGALPEFNGPTEGRTRKAEQFPEIDLPPFLKRDG